ncbi:poly(A) RNA polymerase, mitochondrial [Macrosteles quadrilineatus]|uniref:poly(A) RNA polymerase, mitochondrial n=1 Tax=Macrosteles quadrilineatus TaxID=74068 RepID=UPI0023E20FE4|nr:poly(A) RNA polymerase, mitochondrial [Macrosteles quadrilineatus]
MLLRNVVRKKIFQTAQWNGKIQHISEFKFHSSSLLCSKGNPEVTGRPSSDEFIAEPFDCEVARRRQQAQCSVVVQVHSEQSCGQLHDYCSEFGEIKTLHHYTPASNPSMHFILVEFKDNDVIPGVLNACGYNERNQVIPVSSRMLWFRANQKKKLSKSNSKLTVPLIMATPPLTRPQLLEWLRESETVSDQVRLVYGATRLDDLGVRLRYLTAHQLEAAVSGLFPRAQVRLFGSSVNGFGRQGCDLDLVLQLDNRSEEEDTQCRLMFHAKPSLNVRSQTQRHIDGLADMVQWFLPGCMDVRRILQARVPIVKFRQELTDIDCDLTLTNMAAVFMSELLYLFGSCDCRTRPLVFTVRRWAADVGLTNPSPGRWVSNFSLTLLVIFYLQWSKVLPTLDQLRQLAGKADRRIAEDGVNCTFLRDPSKISPSDNSSSIEELLLGFFEYYAGFDFCSQGISLGPGAPVRKRDHSAMFIVNPLEPHLNVSQNVSLEETERLRIACRNAAWELESGEEVHSTDQDWGLLRLFNNKAVEEKTKQLEHLYFAPKRKSRLVVSKLFEEDVPSSKKASKTAEKKIAR